MHRLEKNKFYCVWRFSLLAGFVLWGVEAYYLFRAGYLGEFGYGADFLFLMAQGMVLFLLTAAILGFFEAIAVRLSWALASRLTAGRDDVARERRHSSLAAGFLTLLASPAIALFSWRLFQGKGISRSFIAAPGPYVVGCCLAAIAFAFARFLVGQAKAYVRWGCVPRARGLAVAVVAGGAVPFLYYADSHYYVSLYGYVHYALLAAEFILAQASVAVIYALFRPVRKTSTACAASFRGPAMAMAALLAFYALSARHLALRDGLRSWMFGRTVIQSRLLRLYAGLRAFPMPAIETASMPPGRGMEEPRYSNSPLSGAARGMNVLLITIDCLRSDGLDYGRDKNSRTPNIDRLCQRAFVFPNAFLQSRPYTEFALSSLLSSSIRLDVDDDRFAHTLATLLGQNGYETIRVTSTAVDVKSRVQTMGGFKHDAARAYVEGRLVSSKYKDWMNGEAADRALKRYAGRKFFMWVHYLSPHDSIRGEIPASYVTPGGDDKQLYLDAIAYTDYLAGKLLKGLVDEGIDGKTVVVVTSDHGEGHGEHVARYHVDKLYNEFIRLPLIVYVPGLKGGVIDRNVGMMDVAPTLLDLVGIDAPPEFQGRSLLRCLLPQWRNRDEDLFCAVSGGYALIRDGWKLIYDGETGTYELYDLKGDPGERVNLVERERAVFRDLGGALASHMVRRGFASGVRDATCMNDGKALQILRGGGKEGLHAKLEALKRLGESPPRKETLEALTGCLRAPEPEVRREAAYLLGRMGTGAQGGEMARALEAESDVMARVRMVQALGKLRVRGAVDGLLAALSGDDVILRRAAIVSLGEIGDARAAEALISLLSREDDPTLDPETIKAVLSALVRLNDEKAILAAAGYLSALQSNYLGRRSPIRGGDEEGYSTVTGIRDCVYEAVARHGTERIVSALIGGLPRDGCGGGAAARLALAAAWARKKPPPAGLFSFRDVDGWVSDGGGPVRGENFGGPLAFLWVACGDGALRGEGTRAALRTAVKSSCRQNGYLLFFHRTPLEIYLNGERVAGSEDSCPSRWVDYLTGCAGLPLREGDNEVAVALQTSGGDCGFAAILFTLPRGGAAD